MNSFSVGFVNSCNCWLKMCVIFSQMLRTVSSWSHNHICPIVMGHCIVVG